MISESPAIRNTQTKKSFVLVLFFYTPSLQSPAQGFLAFLRQSSYTLSISQSQISGETYE